MLFLLAGTAAAQVISPVAPTTLQNVIQLAASGSVEVQQDLLSISMSTTREGADAMVIQTQLKTALDNALAEAKKSAQPGQLDVRTGNFSLYPRYGRDGKITAWQGTTELVLEGRDFARISATAGKIQTKRYLAHRQRLNFARSGADSRKVTALQDQLGGALPGCYLAITPVARVKAEVARAHIELPRLC